MCSVEQPIYSKEVLSSVLSCEFSNLFLSKLFFRRPPGVTASKKRKHYEGFYFHHINAIKTDLENDLAVDNIASLEIVYLQASRNKSTQTYFFFRRPRLQMFYRVGVLKDFGKFTGKCLCCSHFLRKLQVSRHATLLKRESSTGVFL